MNALNPPQGRHACLSEVASIAFAAVCTATTLVRGAVIDQPQATYSCGDVQALAITPDGSKFLTGGNSGAFLWDLATGAYIRSFEGHTWTVDAVAISADGKRAVTGSSDHTARLWDLATGRLIRNLTHTNWVASVAISADGNLILTAVGKTAKLWKASSGSLVRTLTGHLDDVEAVAFSSDAKRILTGSWDDTAKLWDTATGASVCTFVGHSTSVYSVAFSQDGSFVMTADSGGVCILWDTSTSQVIRRIETNVSFSPCAALSPAGDLVFCGGWHSPGGFLWSTQGDFHCELSGDAIDYVHINSAAFLPTGRQILLACGDKKVRLLNLNTLGLPDTMKPHLDILTPSGAKYTNTLVSVVGNAQDNIGVAGIWYNLNHCGWSRANGTNNWATPALQLIPGTNALEVYAMDLTGNSSNTGRVTMAYVQTDRLTVRVSGQGTITPNLDWQFLEVGKTYTMTAKPAVGFGFVNWTSFDGVVTNYTTIKFLMRSNLVLTANFVDMRKPSITVASPKANQQVSNAMFTVTGTAKDSVGVSRVWVQLNTEPWTTAVGTTDWARQVTLTPGTNNLKAYATDFAGNRSATNLVKCVYLLSAPLVVQIVGQGTITPDYNRKLLQIGKQYRMTAKPLRGSKFAGWTGSSATTDATLKFTMVSNMNFTATFIDTNRPVNVVTYPAVNAKVTNDVISAKGKATDNVGVTMVWYQFNSNGWSQAITTNLWTNWITPPLALLPRTNVIQTVAEDVAGNLSLTNTVRFIRH